MKEVQLTKLEEFLTVNILERKNMKEELGRTSKFWIIIDISWSRYIRLELLSYVFTCSYYWLYISFGGIGYLDMYAFWLICYGLYIQVELYIHYTVYQELVIYPLELYFISYDLWSLFFAYVCLDYWVMGCKVTYSYILCYWLDCIYLNF